MVHVWSAPASACAINSRSNWGLEGGGWLRPASSISCAAGNSQAFLLISCCSCESSRLIPESALSVASSGLRVECVDELLRAGADPTARDAAGCTPASLCRDSDRTKGGSTNCNLIRRLCESAASNGMLSPISQPLAPSVFGDPKKLSKQTSDIFIGAKR